MAKTGKAGKVCIALLILSAFCPSTIFSDEITVEAEVNKTEVYQGGSFIYQIRVIGSDQVTPPELEMVEQFDVQFLGGRVNSSTTITIINNKTIEEVHKEYILPYKMVPTELGKLKIPPVTITIDKKQYKTDPITITAEKPRETDAFMVSTSFSKSELYVGEPVLFSLVWYIGDDVNSFDLRVPFFDRKEFRFSDPPLTGTQGSATRLRIPLGGQEITAIRGETRLDKRQYTTLTINKVVTPRKTGTYYIPKALVSLVSGSTPFVIPSNELTLSVKPLPEQNKPKDFSGIVGELSITAEAKPREVAVLEPITVTLSLSGAPYLEHLKLPDIGELDGFRDQFKLTGGVDTTAVSSTSKSVTFSIRPLHPEIMAIPPISVSYFDPEQKRYRKASSKPIPITVRQEQVMSLEDLEGTSAGESLKDRADLGKQLLTENHTTPAALRNNSSRFLSYPLHLFFIALSPAAAAVSFFFYRKRKRKQPPTISEKEDTRLEELRNTVTAGLASYQAASLRCDHSTDTFVYCEKLYKTVMTYLCSELSLTCRSSTPEDSISALREMGYSHTTIAQVKTLLNRLQQLRYTGTLEGRSVGEAVNDCYNKTINCIDLLQLDRVHLDRVQEEEAVEK